MESPTEVNILALAILTIYLIVKDVIAPMIRNRSGGTSNGSLIKTDVAVLQNDVDNIKSDMSEMKKDIKYLRRHSK